MSSPYWGLFMGFEHEHIHFETSSVLIRQVCVSFTAVRRSPGPIPLLCSLHSCP